MVLSANTARPILVISSGLFFFDLGLSIYFFLFNLFLITRGFSQTQIGFLISAMAAGNLVGAIPAARLIARTGIKKALLTCLLGTPVILLARALAPVLPMQIVFAFLTGLMLSLWAVCISPAVAETTGERERPFAFSLLFSVGIGMGAVGGLAGGWIPAWLNAKPHSLHALSPYQVTLIASSCIALIGAWPACKLKVSRPAITSGEAPRLSPFLARFLPAVALWGLVTGSFSPLATVFFAIHLKMPLHQIATVFSVSQLVQVAGVLCAPLIFRRFGVMAGTVFTQLATAICFTLLAIGNGVFFSSSVYIALTAFQWMNEPGLYSLLMSGVPREQRGGASASMALALSLSQLVAAAASGWAFSRFGYAPVLMVIALIAVLAAGLFRTVVPVHANAEGAFVA